MDIKVELVSFFKEVLRTIVCISVVVIFLIGSIYVSGYIILMPEPITAFSYKNNVLVFQDDNNNQYKLPLTKEIVIKPTDKLELSYTTIRGEIRNIFAVYVNGKLVYEGQPYLSFVVTKFK